MTPQPSRWAIAILPIALIAVAVTGCTSPPPAEPIETETSTSTPEPVPTQEPVVLSFRVPGDCTGLLGADRQEAFATAGMELLGGPGGKYPNFYADPTPEELAGGISCVWGDEAAPKTMVTVSAAPVTASTRGTIVESLLAQGLNEAVVEDGISYAQIGDQNSAPAVLNIIRDDSWISVIQASGGEDYFTASVELAEEAAAQVYVP